MDSHATRTQPESKVGGEERGSLPGRSRHPQDQERSFPLVKALIYGPNKIHCSISLWVDDGLHPLRPSLVTSQRFASSKLFILGLDFYNRTGLFYYGYESCDQQRVGALFNNSWAVHATGSVFSLCSAQVTWIVVLR